MSRFSLITFDCYGTLIDWERGMKDALWNLTRKRNLAIDIAPLPERYIEIELEIENSGYRKYKDVLSLGVGRLFGDMGIELSVEEKAVFAETIGSWPPFEETGYVLKELKENHKIAILSNIDDDIISRSVDLIGVDFDYVVTAEQVKSYKPSSGHWERILETSGLPREQILHVAASYVHDIAPAKEMGFTAVWINRKGEEVLGDIRPDYILRDLTDLSSIL